MPEGLRAHLRYPEDLFRVQTNVYSKYQLDPADFFERDGAWSVAQAPSPAPRETVTIDAQQPTAESDEREPALVTETSNVRFVPYYTMFGEGEQRDFVLLRPFVPFSRDDQRRELQAFMTASSDPATYGDLTVFEVQPSDRGLPDGPLSIANSMQADAQINEEITLQQRGGSRVKFGDLQLINIAGGLLWVRPFYVTVDQESGTVASVTEYEFVMATYDERSAYATTLGGALGELFPGLDADIGERSDIQVDAVARARRSGGVRPGLRSESAVNRTPARRATGPLTRRRHRGRPPICSTRLTSCCAPPRNSCASTADLGAYQERVNQAADLVGQALEALGDGSTTSTEPLGEATVSTEPVD